MLLVLSILQMKVNTNVILPLDTVLLHGLPSSTSRVELVQELSKYGKIKSIAVAKGSSGFGYCCFVDEDSVKKAISYQSSIMINGVTPAISLLHGSSNLQFAESNCAQTDGSTKCKKSGRLLCSI